MPSSGEPVEMDQVEVLVVGAGPVGLVAAVELLRRGRRVAVIDAAAGPATSSRALGTHARTLEVYDQLGIRDALADRARRVDGFAVHQDGHRLTRFALDFALTPTVVDASWFIAQTDTEAVLRDAVAAHGGRVGWGTRMVDLDDDGVRVMATVENGGARRRIAADYLIGADGGHSFVRKHLGVEFPGASDETWMVADAEIDWDLAPDSIHMVRTPGGTVVAFPFAADRRWRLLDTTDVTVERPEVLADRFSAKLTAGLRRPVRVSAPTWSSRFTIQQRQAAQLRAGRVFLAGDAAHVHSPASGQGMNTGIQDAHNLAWKIDAVLAGADEALLDTYQAERHPVSADLLRTARIATRLIQGRGRTLQLLTRPALALLDRLPAAHHRVSGRLTAGFSALTIRYPSPALPGTGAEQTTVADTGTGAPRPGERVTCLTAAQAATEQGRALLAALREPVPILLDLAPPSNLADLAHENPRLTYLQLAGDPFTTWARTADWYLIRPDGYLLARGRSTDRLYLTAALRYLGADARQKAR